MDILKHPLPIKSLIFFKLNCHAKMAPDNVNEKFLLLRLGKKAGAASGFEAPQPFDASLIVGLAPASDRVVVEIKRLSGPLATPAVVKKQHGVGSSRQTLLGTAVTQKRDQLRALPGRKKTAANHA